MRIGATFFLSWLIWLLAACSFQVAAPPARLSLPDPPSVTPPGEIGLSMEITAAADIFGPSLEAETFGIALGLPGRREMVFRPVFGSVTPDDSLGQENRFLGMALDLKQGVMAASTVWAASYWGGGGYLYSPFGEILSVHAGYGAGKESGFIRPFVALDIFGSAPFNTRPIRVRGEYEEENIEKSLTFTLGGRISMGLKLQVVPGFSLVGDWGLGRMNSRTDKIGFFQIGGAAEWMW